MNTLLPFLYVITCAEGYHCKSETGSYFPMPDWETCVQMANPQQRDIKVKQEFVSFSYCVGRETPNDQ